MVRLRGTTQQVTPAGQLQELCSWGCLPTDKGTCTYCRCVSLAYVAKAYLVHNMCTPTLSQSRIQQRHRLLRRASCKRLGPAPQRGVRHKHCLLKTQYCLQCANEIGKQTSRPTIKKARTTTGKPKYVRLRNGAENSLAQATTSVNTPTSPMRGPADPSSRCKLCSSTMGVRLSGISAIARQHNKSRRASQPNQYYMPHSTPQHTGQAAQAAGTSCEPDAASGTAAGQCNAMPEFPDPSMHACAMSTAQDASPHFTSG